MILSKFIGVNQTNTSRKENMGSTTKNIIRASTLAATLFVAMSIPHGILLCTLGTVLYILYATVNLKKAPQVEPIEEVRLSHH